MNTQWGMWISGIMRLAFLVYLITAAWQDVKYRSIRFSGFAGFGIAGGVLRFTFLCMECSIPGSWQPAVADTVMALGIGGGLLVLSVLTRQAVAAGSSWCPPSIWGSGKMCCCWPEGFSSAFVTAPACWSGADCSGYP